LTETRAPAGVQLELYSTMVRIRLFEEKTAELFEGGKVKGTAHSSVGQEAVAAGAGSVLRPDDYLVGHHRSHGHLIAKGARTDLMMAELLGRRTGYCKGFGGSMHIADLSLGVLGCNGVVGAGPPLGTGAALSSVLLDQGRVAVVFFGDGAAGEGATHEAMNLAAVWKLPVVFVCENNQFALTTEWQESRAVEDVAGRAAAYGMPGEIVDGNDVLAVREALARYVGAAREGAGPALVEAKTYRRMEHSMRANLPETRDLALAKVWETKDPISRLEKRLLENGEATPDELNRIREEAREEIDAAVAFGLNSEPAAREDLLPAVYAPHRKSYPEPGTSRRKLGFLGAVREALEGEMEKDESVVVIGEDVRMGGIFRATEGLLERFGPERVRNTPISEAGFTGAAVGAAMTGLRPVVEVQIFDFVTLAMDAIVNQAAKLRFMMGGTPKIPLVVRGPSGGGVRLGAQHSQSLEAWFAHVPGLVVVMPSNPRDAKGLLAAAIRDDNPVVFLEPKSLFFAEGEVPEEPYAVPLGKARVAREGTDVTVVACGSMVPQALRAARALEREGVSLEVVDVRTLYPLDEETILGSVRKTHRAVVAHEAVRFGGIGAEIAATITEKAFWYLDLPVRRVGAPHHPVPYEDALERETLPDYRDVVDVVRRIEEDY
jgi:2-oxoisovalerate dehydrogenase E1 component